VTTTGQALLVMDVQKYVLSRFADAALLLDRVQYAIVAARKALVPVIYVTVAFRDGHPEVSSRNQMMSRLAENGALLRGDEATAIHPDVQPEPADILLTKYRVSAFAGSELDLILHSQEIDTLVLTGIITSGVVLSTVRDASDRDYRLTVLSDACDDPDREVHSILVDRVFPRQAQVITVDEWASSLTVGRDSR
jgi:nicotinamidase-related amidase